MSKEHARIAVMEGAELQWVPIRNLVVHPTVQRKFKISQARRILAAYDPGKLTPPHVNVEDGAYVVYEGQHRLWATTHWLNGEAGPGDQEMLCWVRKGAPHKQLAAERLATDSQVKMTPVDRHLMAVIAGEQEAIVIKAVLGKYRLQVAQTGGPGILQCVSACRRIATRPAGAKMLDRVIGMLNAAFGTKVGAYDHLLVSALGLLVFKFGRDLEDKKMVAVLATGERGAPGIVAAGKEVAHGLATGAVYGVIRCLLRAYNKGRKKPLSWEAS